MPQIHLPSSIAMYLFLLSTLSSLGYTSPPTLLRRNILAGGPPITPIPSNCTLKTISPTDPAVTAFKLNKAFSTAHTVFTTYLPTEFNITRGQLTCLEQCYGFGSPGQCLAALWGQNVTHDAYGYSLKGNACVMFDLPVLGRDLVAVSDGEYRGARVTNIRCPSLRNP